jgi:hypothetical protein
MTEAEIRNALISRLASSPAGAGAAFISEMFVDGFSRRADLIMANGKLAVFEIKSERDTLERLEGQLASYEKFFEQVTIVCAEKHRANVQELVSEKIGIWSVKSDGHLSVVRAAKASKLPSLNHWLSFLPVDELKALLKQQSIKATGSREALLSGASGLSLRVARSYVLDYLKRRDKRIEERRAQQSQRRDLQNTSPQKVSTQQLHEYLKTLSCSAVAIPRRRAHSSNSSPSASSIPDAIKADRSICRDK